MIARPLAAAIALHVAVALAWVLAMRADPKPLKFAVSIAIFLATVAYILAIVDLGERVRGAIAWTLALTMVVEMCAIAVQALRGVGSHFNTTTAFDAVVWKTMMVAIVVATVAVVTLAWFATTRALRCGPYVAFGLRVGLWLVLLVVVSGFAMGGRNQHSVGGLDGGAALPLAGWSREHGDLRVAHFFALHGLQALPIAGLVLERLEVGDRTRWVLAGTWAIRWVALSIAALVQAFAGRPFWRGA